MNSPHKIYILNEYIDMYTNLDCTGGGGYSNDCDCSCKCVCNHLYPPPV